MVAFLNGQPALGGAIYWGIRDADRAIQGVRLSDKECDELRRVVTEKLHQISPPLAPSDYQIILHALSDGQRPLKDEYVIEVCVPPCKRRLLFSTGGQEILVRTDAGKRTLSALEIQHEILKRFKIDPLSE